MSDANLPLKIDIEELIFALQTNDPMIDSYLDLQTGDIITTVDGNDEEDVAQLLEDDPSRFRFIRPLPAHEALSIMEDFAEEVERESIQNRLYHALGSHHPFRDFKNVLLDYPDLREQWFAYQEDAMREQAESWLKEEGVTAVFQKQRERRTL